MKLLGITGGIGAGKSTVARLFSELGATCIDADSIGHQILNPGEPAYNAVVLAFGDRIILPNKTIDRKVLAKIVFKDPEKLNLLNQITHREIFKKMDEEIKKADTELVCLDVPLLFSSDFPFPCTKTIAVLAPLSQRIKRVMERDGSTEETVLARIKNQMSDEELQQKADFVLMNDGDPEDIKKRVYEIYQQVMELSE